MNTAATRTLPILGQVHPWKEEKICQNQFTNQLAIVLKRGVLKNLLVVERTTKTIATGVFMAGPTFDQSINTKIVSTIDAAASAARVLISYSHCFQWLRKRRGGSEKGKQFRFYEHINLGRLLSRTMSKFREYCAVAWTKGIFLRRLTDISINPFGITTWGVAYLMSCSIFELAKVFGWRLQETNENVMLCFAFDSFSNFKRL